MDTIIRNARIQDGEDQPTFDIGIDAGRIAAIDPSLAADGEEIDAGGRLVSPGFIESHIHLDNSCILDRCKSEKGDLEEAIEQMGNAKAAFAPYANICQVGARGDIIECFEMVTKRSASSCACPTMAWRWASRPTS